MTKEFFPSSKIDLHLNEQIRVTVTELDWTPDAEDCLRSAARSLAGTVLLKL